MASTPSPNFRQPLPLSTVVAHVPPVVCGGFPSTYAHEQGLEHVRGREHGQWAVNATDYLRHLHRLQLPP